MEITKRYEHVGYDLNLTVEECRTLKGLMHILATRIPSNPKGFTSCNIEVVLTESEANFIRRASEFLEDPDA